MAQDTYLSPREILKRLKTMESRITRHNNVEYETEFEGVTGPLSLEQLNREATRMLAFMNMFLYTPKCVFDTTLEPNTGGQIALFGQTSGDLKISINPSIRSDARQLLACLAHELCHKRLEDSHIMFNEREENEYHADLCTIYMGFGKLILNGYNVHNNAMGYLVPGNYEDAYDIMQVMRSLALSTKPAELKSWDPFLCEALTEWIAEPDKPRLLRSKFMEKQREMAVLAKHTHLVRQLLDIIDGYPRKGLEWYSDTYDSYKNHEDMSAYPIHAFSALYDMEHNLFNAELTKRAKGINVALMSLLASLERFVPELKGSVLQYDRIVCPFCGAKKRSDTVRGDRRMEKCDTCKRYFVIDRSLMDMRDVRQEIVDKGVSMGEGSVNEAYLRGKNDGAVEGHAKAEKEKREALAKQQRMLENKYKDLLVQKYQQGLEAARAADAPELKKAVLNDVPGWVRWLVKPYLKSNEEQE